MEKTTEELVTDYIVKQYRQGTASTADREVRAHLQACGELAATHVGAEDSTYGCETGCDYTRFEADMTCPHGYSDRFEYGEFGHMDIIVSELIPEWSTVGNGADS